MLWQSNWQRKANCKWQDASAKCPLVSNAMQGLSSLASRLGTRSTSSGEPSSKKSLSRQSSLFWLQYIRSRFQPPTHVFWIRNSEREAWGYLCSADVTDMWWLLPLVKFTPNISVLSDGLKHGEPGTICMAMTGSMEVGGGIGSCEVPIVLPILLIVAIGDGNSARTCKGIKMTKASLWCHLTTLNVYLSCK